jgi:hypothetical protein
MDKIGEAAVGDGWQPVLHGLFAEESCALGAEPGLGGIIRPEVVLAGQAISGSKQGADVFGQH